MQRGTRDSGSVRRRRRSAAGAAALDVEFERVQRALERADLPAPRLEDHLGAVGPDASSMDRVGAESRLELLAF